MVCTKAPNRPFCFEDLRTSFFRQTLTEMQELLEKRPDLYLHPSKQWEYPWALSRVKLNAGDTVLDAGCGHSVFPLYLAKQGCNVTGCDLDVPAESEKVNYVKSDITSLPFADSSFDAVFCISVIEHLPRPKVTAALSEFRRVLKAGGRLLLTTDYYQDADAELAYSGPGESFPVDWNFFDERLLRECLLCADGFEVVGETQLGVDWQTTKEKMRKFHGYPYTSIGLCLRKA